MKRKLPVLLAAAAVILEAIPKSAVITVTGGEETKRLYFSCFDPTPFLDRSFGPLLTAVASALLLIAALIHLSGKAAGLLRALAGAAFVFSLLPLFGNGETRCALGIVIALVLLAETAIVFLPLPEKERQTARRRKKKGRS